MNLVAAQSPPDSPNQQFGETARLNRQMDELDRHTQALLRKSHWVRKERFWDKLDTSSIEAYEASIEPFRQEFREEVIGRFDLDLLPPNAHTRLIAESDKWKRYEVVVDVFDGLFAYGILTVPTDIKHQERRPVVVCQHGLEGAATERNRGERLPVLQGLRDRVGRAGLRDVRPAKPLHFRRSLSDPATQGQLTGEDALLDHDATTPTDCRLAPKSTIRRSRSYRILWLELWGQNGHAGATAGDRLLFVNLLCRFQRMGRQERLDTEPT